jgi:hypothetical protein
MWEVRVEAEISSSSTARDYRYRFFSFLSIIFTAALKTGWIADHYLAQTCPMLMDLLPFFLS